MAGETKTVAGPGMRVLRLPGNEILSARPVAWKWDSAWKVRHGGSYVTVGYGLVNGVEPTIKGVTISAGGDEKEQPRIPLPERGGYDSEGRAWVVLEVRADKTSGHIPVTKDGLVEKDAATVRLRVDAGANDWPESEEVGICALAMIHATGRVHQVQHFHLNYKRIRPTADVAKYKQYHLFW